MDTADQQRGIPPAGDGRAGTEAGGSRRGLASRRSRDTSNAELLAFAS